MLVKPGFKRKKKTDIWSVAAPQQEQYMIADIIAKLVDICTYKSVAEKADIPTTSMQFFLIM